MSTKIYDAFELTDRYDLVSLNKALINLRNEVSEICKAAITDMVVYKFLYDYYTTLLHSERCLAGRNEDDKTILNSMLEGSLKKAWGTLYCNVLYKIADNSRQSYPCSGYNFYCKLLLFPLEDKILAMYFGMPEIRRFIENHPMFRDYHYQNQCDKPDDISDEDWSKRESDWEKAIGPDYFPLHHGFAVQLFDAENILPVFNPGNIKTISFPDDDRMIKQLYKTFDKNTSSDEIDACIRNKITFIHSKEELCKCMGF